MVLQYPHATIWKHSGQILSTGKITLNTVKYWVLQIELVSIHNTVKYPRQLLATIWEHTKYRWIPLATLNTQIIFFLNIFSDGHEAATKDGDHRPFCSRASIVFIQTNPAKIQIYWQLLLATQIPANTQVFDGIWGANIKYLMLSNTAEYYMGTKPLGRA